MNGPECKICGSPKVADINRALDAGQSERAVAAAFAFPRTTLQRHARHRAKPPTTPPALVQAAKAARAAARAPKPTKDAAPDTEPTPALIDGGVRAEAVLEAESKIRQLADEALRLVRDASGQDEDGKADPDVKGGTFRERSACLLAASRVLELLAKLLGELGPDIEIRVLAMPQWQAIQMATLEALEPYPPALEAVAAAWRRLSA